MKTKQFIINALVASLYVVVTMVFPSFTALQLRASEIFAHLPIFNKKYTIGLLLGVAIANLWSPFGLVDVFFGTLHTAISIGLSFFLVRHVTSLTLKLFINATVFSATSAIIAWMILFMDPSGTSFWPMYGSIALSIFVVMALGAPIILMIDRSVQFAHRMNNH